MNLPPASVSVDLDNQWAYQRTQGVAGWESFPSYLHLVTPRILDTFHRAGIRATFFIVGKDAEMEGNHEALRSIVAAGHEIANHSHMHEPWLHLYTDEELRADFERSETAIRRVTEQKPEGFRGPGFSTSPAVRQLLKERGYQYDASLFPTVLSPLLRLWFFCTSRLPKEEKKRRSGLYGGWKNGFSSLRPYEIEQGLLEIPVTTMPLFRAPVHLSYLLFLAQYSEVLARCYWRLTLWLCHWRKVQPSLLLHPTDFIDATEVPEMAFFPAMKVPSERKVALVRFALSTLRQHWRVGSMQSHAQAWRAAASGEKTEAPRQSLFQSSSSTPQSHPSA